MKLRKQFLVTASIALSLFLTSSFTAAQTPYSDNIRPVVGTETGPVRGNPSIPSAGSSDDVENNTVIIGGGNKVNGKTYGGISKGDGNVSGNKVIIESGGTANGDVYGGYSSGKGNVTDNEVEVSGSITGFPLLGEVHGGYSDKAGDVVNNKVVVKNGGKTGFTTGGYSQQGGDVIGNTVIIEIGGTATSVYGGYSERGGKVTKNEVIISGSVTGFVYGGYASTKTNDSDVTENSVTIENGGKVKSISGGFTEGSGVVSGNKVTIKSGGEATEDVFGGKSMGDGDVIGNEVIIENGGIVTKKVYGGFTSGGGNVTGNSVKISSTVNYVAGGNVNAGKGEVKGNIVIIENGGKADAVDGGYSGGSGAVTGNKVIIENGGTVKNVYGGTSDGKGDITNNTVIIRGEVTGKAFSGYGGAYSTGAVSNNTLILESTATLSGAKLYGHNNNPGGGSGNTLNVNGFVGDVEEINNFDIYNITIGQLDSSLTVLNITGNIHTNIDGADITIKFAPDFLKNALNIGDVITVISKINANADPLPITIEQSPFIDFSFIDSVVNEVFTLALADKKLQQQTKFVGEGFAAGLAFLGQAADVRSSIYFVPQGPKFTPFAKMIYGKQYISTGSSVNVKGFSALAGLAFNTNFDNGSQLVVGAFIEGGWGDYDSRNSFSNSATIKGNGDTEYYGGGLLARYATTSGLYGEGTFAAGKTETDFRTYDFAPGTRSKYDYSVPYYSAHIGVGKLFNMCDIFGLDIYGKYLWTRQSGDNITVDGYRFKFKDADSHRLRAGGKLQATAMPQLQPYAGAAFEYEFSGKIKGNLYGMDMDKPSLRGGTGIGELGLVWSPTESGNFKVDLGAQGYVGKREGVSGGLAVSLSF